MATGNILLTMLMQSDMALQDTLAKLARSAAGRQVQHDAVSPQQVVSGIKSIDWDELLQNMADKAIDLALRIMAPLLVYYVGKFVIARLVSVIRRAMDKRRDDASLRTFLVSLVRISLMLLLVITCVGILGVETSSFIAVFASAGVAVGMALSGTLQNFAGGVLILLLKPYRVGDYITYDTYSGYVREIQIFHTVITTYNNQRIVMPNGPLSTGIVKNDSGEPFLRIEWHLAIAYGDDVGKARAVLIELLNADKRIVHEYSHEELLPSATAADDGHHAKRTWWRRIFSHAARIKAKAAQSASVTVQMLPCEPTVNVDKLDESSVSLIVRAWTRTGDHWSTYYSMLELFYAELPKHGLNFPFKQIDVNFKKN